jgi:hypothetical protein
VLWHALRCLPQVLVAQASVFQGRQYALNISVRDIGDGKYVRLLLQPNPPQGRFIFQSPRFTPRLALPCPALLVGSLAGSKKKPPRHLHVYSRRYDSVVLLQAGSFSVGRRSSPYELPPGAITVRTPNDVLTPGASAAVPAAAAGEGHSTPMVVGIAVSSLVVGAAGAALLMALSARYRQSNTKPVGSTHYEVSAELAAVVDPHTASPCGWSCRPQVGGECPGGDYLATELSI